MKIFNLSALSVLLLLTLIIVACKQDNRAVSAEEKILLKNELRHPGDYILVQCKWTNLIGPDSLTFGVFNTAKIAEFKNVKVKVNFQSISGEILGSELYDVPENLPPGKRTSFSKNCDSPRGTFKAEAEFVSAGD